MKPWCDLCGKKDGPRPTWVNVCDECDEKGHEIVANEKRPLTKEELSVDRAWEKNR
jgi:ribosome-binding protein aMBF1 (putative translation factor)